MAYNTSHKSDQLQACNGVSELASAVVPSAAALEFLHSLIDDDFDDRILCSDNLDIISLLSDTHVGKFTLSTSFVDHQEHGPCILVHANSRGIVNKVPCGMTVTAYIRRPHLETLEHRQHEFVTINEKMVCRESFIVRRGESYIISSTQTDKSENVRKKSCTVSVKNMEGFISEGANLLLIKLLVAKGFRRDFHVTAMNLDLQLCTAKYELPGKRTTIIGGKEIEVTIVSRRMGSVSNPAVWHTSVTAQGRILSRVQIGSPIRMKRPSLGLISGNTNNNNSNNNNSNDRDGDLAVNLMIASGRNGRQPSAAATDAVNYLHSHPELNVILTDYLQFLLLHQPSDVFAFSAKYFSAFRSSLDPHR